MDGKERNAIFEAQWPALKNVIFHIWNKHPTSHRIGTIDDVLNEAGLAVLQAIPKFIPAPHYENESKAVGHMKSYLVSVIHNCLIFKSRCASLVRVSAYAAANVFHGTDLIAKAAVHCSQLDGMPITMSQDPYGDEEHGVVSLNVAVNRLQDDERDIIIKFYGLDGCPNVRTPLGIIAKQYGLTRNAARRRVRAIESKLKLMMSRD